MFNSRLKVTLRSEKDNKKFAKIKFSKEETILINTISTMLGMTVEEVIVSAIKSAIDNHNLKNPIQVKIGKKFSRPNHLLYFSGFLKNSKEKLRLYFIPKAPMKNFLLANLLN